MGRWPSPALLAIFVTIALAMNSIIPAAAHTGLKVGFYRHSCPQVEAIVYNSMAQSTKADDTVAPGILRMAFHDCFVRVRDRLDLQHPSQLDRVAELALRSTWISNSVFPSCLLLLQMLHTVTATSPHRIVPSLWFLQGCDASVLLEGPNTERRARTNTGLHGFDAIDAAKRAVENACPGVVSAADVLQFAARDAVVLAGGYGWHVPAGRRDGTVSIMEEALNLPAPSMTVSQLIDVFGRKGLSPSQMVVLSGAHTIGKAPCVTFDDRVQTTPVDPTLAPSFATFLKGQCPYAAIQSTSVDMDSTAHTFDSQYFKDIIAGRGLLTSDQSLLYDSRTSGGVYANNGAAFYRNFAKAMVKMSQIEVLTGLDGEIRRQFDQVNSH
ncbi:peroxidase 71 isoform X1 [Physcomitrium patens]|uniref:peroxidase 71 isoform X1 n=1 Tax=Physcomitrium patens TaxID=3218 RepID=UPI000D166E81|nr:peroxidase 64-like isoform X1 [Physcomitrium patens]|eukprot:XP_024366134.1 peroxidase 64-like isoform X1 [Physcomitrella patens]